jgi:hypothetical protein
MLRSRPPEVRHSLIKVLLIAVALLLEHGGRELLALGGGRGAFAVVL